MIDSPVEHSEPGLGQVRFPHLTGLALRLFTALVEGPLAGLLIPKLFRDGGIQWLRNQEVTEPPTFFPVHDAGGPTRGAAAVPQTARPVAAAVPRTAWPVAPAAPGPGFRFATVEDYARAYREGQTTPVDVAHRVLQAIEAGDAATPPLRAMIAVDRDEVLRLAAEATARIREGRVLSVFDGVPVAVKDEVDLVPYPTTVGTAFLGKTPASEDSTVVARMRAAGALFIGKANMHEIGIGVTGLNTIHGTPRNPYATGHFTGGSSSGSGAAVASGLCPVAISADAGGSIRIPASFCGIVGLKPTFGRVSEFGAAPLCWSMAHLGPIAATATDAALAYGVMAGPDPKDSLSWHQPAPTLDGWDQRDLSGLTLGVCWPWFRNARADVASAGEAMVRQFERLGARLCEVAIPDLDAGRIAHTITVAAEMSQALGHLYADHRHEHGLDVRVGLALARAFTARDYLQAQRVRTRLMAAFARALDQADVVVTPTTGIPSPSISRAAVSYGESDLTSVIEIMRFVTPANMTGLPAISFPAGYTDAGLPIGLQAIGRAWQEPILLRLALAAERIVERKAPRIHFRLLPQLPAP